MLAPDLSFGTVVTAVGGPLFAGGLSLGIAMAGCVGFTRLRGTTLGAPAAWTIVSGLALAAVEMAIAWYGATLDPMSASLWRYASATSAFCPLMAVLGAKRPQDGGWQWVVLSLWVILLVPAMQAIAARSGERLELYGAWKLLLVALIAMGLLNYLPTRYAIAAILCAIGQTLLLAPYLFDVDKSFEGQLRGIVVLLVALLSVGVISVRRTAQSSGDEPASSPLRELDDRWLAFRDGWGAFWGLRILQRINQTAELSRWPVRLEWRDGFVSPDDVANHDAPSAETLAHIQQTMDSLLRRFERRAECEVSMPQRDQGIAG